MRETFREQLKVLAEGMRQLCIQGCLECPLNLYPGCGAMLHWTVFDVDAVIASVPECAQLQTNEAFRAKLVALAKDAHEMCAQVAYGPCSKCGLYTNQGCGGALCKRYVDIDTLLANIAEWRKRKSLILETQMQ